MGRCATKGGLNTTTSEKVLTSAAIEIGRSRREYEQVNEKMAFGPQDGFITTSAMPANQLTGNFLQCAPWMGVILCSCADSLNGVGVVKIPPLLLQGMADNDRWCCTPTDILLLQAMTQNRHIMMNGPLHELLLQCKYLRALRKIANGVTHQYNNIFTGLAGQMRPRKQDADAEGVAAKRLALIEDLLRRGMEQTELLFNFSRAGDVTKKDYAPQRLATKALELLNAVSRLHRFSLHCAEDLPKIKVNQRDIVLMLFYLGENAITAMDEGGEIRLEVSCRNQGCAGSLVLFCLIDSGSGMPETGGVADRDLSALSGNGAGLAGVGLYAVRSIVADHGGTLSFAEAPGGGTIATVHIAAAAKVQPENTWKQSTPGTMLLPPSAAKPHVFLVVDDEEALRDVLCCRLQRLKYNAFCVESCAKAVVKFRLLAETITVILIDIGLGDADGYACARELRGINPQVQIVLMSGIDSDPKKIGASGAAFLKKPFTIEQLLQLVKNE